MKSFAYSKDEFDSSLCYKIWTEVNKLDLYFKKFCGVHADEAMQRTLMHALTHYCPSNGDLVPYIKTLARTIMRENNKTVPCDFLEQQQGQDVSKDEEVESDISVLVVEKMTLSESRKEDIVALALTYMSFFMLLCESLISMDTTTIYFPEEFINTCLKLSKQVKTFNKMCLSLYYDYKDDFNAFISSGVDSIGEWREADHGLIKSNISKRVKIVGANGSTNVDPDTEEWSLVGNLQNKIIVKVPFRKEWELMCDLIDADEINQMKFIIDYSYVIKTLGGSLSIVNPILTNEYDLCKSEILTNLLHDLYGRYMCIGSECMYFLVSELKEIPKRRIKGIDLNFEGYIVEV